MHVLWGCTANMQAWVHCRHGCTAGMQAHVCIAGMGAAPSRGGMHAAPRIVHHCRRTNLTAAAWASSRAAATSARVVRKCVMGWICLQSANGCWLVCRVSGG